MTAGGTPFRFVIEDNITERIDLFGAFVMNYF